MIYGPMVKHESILWNGKDLNLVISNFFMKRKITIVKLEPKVWHGFKVVKIGLAFIQ